MTGKNIRRLSVLAVLALFAALQPVAGHAILVESSPAANSTVKGPNVLVKLRFNSRIDGSRSRLTLVLPDGTTQVLKPGEQASPDTLSSDATGLKAGGYKLRWQVLATDGHITRGDVPFTATAR